MKSNIKNLKELIEYNLSIVERGILITILLLKESDPKMTLAKFKTKVKMKDIQTELIRLHEMKFITWSGYKAAAKAEKDKALTPDVREAMSFLNTLWQTKFSPKSIATTTHLKNRLLEHSLDEVKLVIANRYVKWKDDSEMSQYLTPHTIFRPSKFDKYLAEAQKTKKGEGLVEAKRNNLKTGDEITYETSKGLVMEDVYQIRIFTLEGGKRVGSGQRTLRYGRDIKRSLKAQKSSIDLGQPAESAIYYESL